MKDVIRTIVPRFQRVLLIESGRRELLENLIPGIYKTHGDSTVIDVLTCYANQPAGLNPASAVYRVSDYQDGGKGRSRLLNELGQRNYNVLGMI